MERERERERERESVCVCVCVLWLVWALLLVSKLASEPAMGEIGV